MPHLGAARADFSGGNAEVLYNSIQKSFTLPDNVRIFVCYDYPEEGEKAPYQTTIGEQKATNCMINNSIQKKEYIAK